MSVGVDMSKKKHDICWQREWEIY